MTAKQRSPRAPSIDLEDALERARALYREEKGNAAPVDVVLKHWGYNSRNGRSLTLLASVKQYGLIQDEGSGDKRQVRLTDRALRVIRDPREQSTERDEAIRELALHPKVHRDVVDAYPDGLPSDGALQWHLIETLGFTDTGAKEFVSQFRKTIAFAKLDSSATVAEDDEDNEVPVDTEERPSSDVSKPPGGVTPQRFPGLPAQDDQNKVFNIPMNPTETAVVSFPAAVTEEKWARFMTILEAMKPAIITASEPDQETGYQD